MSCWRKLITEALEDNGESWDDVVSHTLSEDEMDKDFDEGYGAVEGCAFTLWTQKRVYFPTQYDGSEDVESVARCPDGKPTCHIGG